jgi:hypothetical protein
MRWLWCVALVTWAGCSGSKETCSDPVQCSAARSYAVCSDGSGGGRYVFSDGTQLTCSAASACQLLLPQVDAWCAAGGISVVDLGVVDLATRNINSLVIPKTGPPYTGPHTDPQLNSPADCPDANLEPNDSQATAIQYGVTVDVTQPMITKMAICPRGDVDFYKIDITGPGNVPVSMKAQLFYDISFGDLDLAFLDSAGRLLAADGTAVTNGCVTSTGFAGTPIYVAVVGANNIDVNRYSVRINATSAFASCP